MVKMKTFGEAIFAAELTLSKRIVERFIESCSHDLKSPLCSIEGLLTIASKYETVDEVRECHNMIGDCVDKMKHMLTSIEEYTSHLQRELQQNEILASELVEKILNENVNDIRESGVEVKVEVDQPVKWISDEFCSYTILKNVIKNAIVFSDHAKAVREISIGIAVNKSYVAIRIADNGIGISEEQQTKLFEPFHRASNYKGGLGLGLFLVKGMVNKLSANIAVSSQEDVGTTVSLHIPNNNF
jgi:signal transduction histidine kinase